MTSIDESLMQLYLHSPSAMDGGMIDAHMIVNNDYFNKFGQMGYTTVQNIPLAPRIHHIHLPPHQRPRRRRTNHSLVATMDPIAVARRNERERNRVKQVNDGFDALRKKVPFLPDKKKLSKVEILRCAMMYIRDLKGVVDEFDHNNTHFPHNGSMKNRLDGSISSSSSTSDDIILLDEELDNDLLQG